MKKSGDMEKKIDALLAELTLEEKSKLIHGPNSLRAAAWRDWGYRV